MINPDFHNIFVAAPSNLMLLLPDYKFTIVEVTDYHLTLLQQKRKDLIGHGLFECYPPNPNIHYDAGSSEKLRASLQKVVDTMVPDNIILRYDIPINGGYETRHWTVTNIPIIVEKAVKYILNTSIDVTLLYKEGFAIS